MRSSCPAHLHSFQQDDIELSGEGRDCELSRRLSARLLFPHADARPGAWLLLLTAVCSFVAVRVLELGAF
jgi:hypothetical protein